MKPSNKHGLIVSTDEALKQTDISFPIYAVWITCLSVGFEYGGTKMGTEIRDRTTSKPTQNESREF